MKKLFIPFLLLFVLILSACGNNETANEDNAAKTKKETFTYQSETGPIEIPKNPKRIIALSNGPNVLALEGNIVGIDQWTNMNPLFQEKLKGVEVVSEDSLEKIIELEPDLWCRDARRLFRRRRDLGRRRRLQRRAGFGRIGLRLAGIRRRDGGRAAGAAQPGAATMASAPPPGRPWSPPWLPCRGST